MAGNKSDKNPAATLATPDDTKADSKPTSLFGGELDLFGAIGLGLGANDRAKELVLKGLLAEYGEKLKLLDEQRKRGKGRPQKGFPNIDIERAAAVLGADDLWREKTGKGVATQKAALELAIQIENILYADGGRARRLFGGDTVTFKRLQDSVSRGLGKLGEAGERFLK